MARRKSPLFRRQKLLLALLQAFGGRLSKRDLQKYLCLFTQTHQQEKGYEFVPYKCGCFSFQSYADLRHLEQIGTITDAKSWQLVDHDDYISQLSDSAQKAVTSFAKRWKPVKGRALASKLKITKQKRLAKTNYALFTIGYEGISLDNYLNKLIKNNIKALCDVRRNPISRKYGFSRSTLSAALQEFDIKYIHIPELGIASERRKTLNTRGDYDRLLNEYEHAISEKYWDSIERLYEIFMANRCVAITCFEAEYRMCHRSRVAKKLAEHPKWRYAITHI